tara:strand:- start:3087 stop:3755 length:669 start_codon:yes stop_codon:yes gene_type:complete
MLGDYKNFITTFINKGYKCIFFNKLEEDKNNQLIIRHDIDLDCKLALELAIIEYKLNIQSTYFFLLTNNSYNLLSKENIDIVKNIQNMGHKVSLHYDPTLSNLLGLETELNIFKQIFGPVDIISLHRPQLKNQLENIKYPTTYDNKYFENTAYFADSRGSFRYGHPFNSDDFKQNKNIQLLLHPFWWVVNSKNKDECINKVLEGKNKDLNQHFQNSLKFYNG